MSTYLIWMMSWLSCILAGTIIYVIIQRLSRSDRYRSKWNTIANWMCISTFLAGGGGVLLLLQLIHPVLNSDGLLHRSLTEYGIFLIITGWLGLFLWWFHQNQHRFPENSNDPRH